VTGAKRRSGRTRSALASGEIAGILDISRAYILVRQHLVGVIMQAALEIEERLALL
jgi:hypothetical protein